MRFVARNALTLAAMTWSSAGCAPARSSTFAAPPDSEVQRLRASQLPALASQRVDPCIAQEGALFGSLLIRLELTAEGAVSSATVDKNVGMPARFVTCALDALRSLKVGRSAAAGGGPVRVHLHFR